MTLNPILSFSATRRMRSFRTMLVVIAFVGVLLLLAFTLLSGLYRGWVYLEQLERSVLAYGVLMAAQCGLILLIAPAMTSGAIAGERERQTLELLLVTNTGSFRILLGKVLESFALLALLICCGLPVTGLCMLAGGIGFEQMLLGGLFLLAVAFWAVSIGVFCSAVSRSTMLSGVLSYLVILTLGVATAVPFLTGYPLRITNVLYDAHRYAALTPGGALKMISPVLYFNTGYGLTALVQGQTHLFSEILETRGWGRLLATWMMMDRAGCPLQTLLSCAAHLLLALALQVIGSRFVRPMNRLRTRHK